MKAEIVLTSSSRPKFLKKVWQSFENHVIINNPMKITFHEDFINKGSNEILNFIEDKADVIIKTKPAKGLGRAFTLLLNKHIKAEYVLYLQDDCIFEKTVCLDEIINVMDKNPNIQQIVFPKKEPINIRKTGKHVNFNGLDLTVNDGWAFMPHVFRVGFMKAQWNNKCKNTRRPESIFGKSLPRQYKERQSYFLGKPDDERVINHAGEIMSTKEML